MINGRTQGETFKILIGNNPIFPVITTTQTVLGAFAATTYAEQMAGVGTCPINQILPIGRYSCGQGIFFRLSKQIGRGARTAGPTGTVVCSSIAFELGIFRPIHDVVLGHNVGYSMKPIIGNHGFATFTPTGSHQNHPARPT